MSSAHSLSRPLAFALPRVSLTILVGWMWLWQLFQLIRVCPTEFYILTLSSVFGLSLCILCFLPCQWILPTWIAYVSHKPVLFLYSLILPWARILKCFCFGFKILSLLFFYVVQKEWHQFVDFFFLESSIFARHGNSHLWQVDFCKFVASLVYILSSWLAKATQ